MKKVATILSLVMVVIGLLLGLLIPMSSALAQTTATTNVGITILPPEDLEYTGEPMAEEVIRFASTGTAIASRDGIYPSVMIGHALLESELGQAKQLYERNNLFGLRESGPGRTGTSGDAYKRYDIQYDSIEDYLDFITTKRFKDAGVVWSETRSEQATLLDKELYPDDPQYGKKILDIIEEYDLTKYDKYYSYHRDEHLENN